MHDIKAIREAPDAFDTAMKKRGLDPQSGHLVALDEKRRSLLTENQALQARRNEASKEIGLAMKAGDKERAETLKAEVATIKDRLSQAEGDAQALEDALTKDLSRLPNLPLDDVPVGEDEEDNILFKTVGEPTAFDFDAKEHFDLGEALGGMDFERAAKLAGSRFVVLKGAIARLSRALGQFMIDLHTSQYGYEEMNTPVLVREPAAYGTGQLPKFEEDFFKTTTDHYLISTAEVTLTNFYGGEILDSDFLPKRITALSQCFRSEAGAAGRDTRGMLRQHQFEKVELVSLVAKEDGLSELDRMLGAAEEVLKRLDLPYRVMTLCSGDLGFGARKTYDIEVWLPGQARYREISSCSYCGDFQARRMKLRHRARGEKQTEFVHTLNGSGLAVGRALIAVMENYQQEDGSIRIPEALQPYMGGLTVITA